MRKLLLLLLMPFGVCSARSVQKELFPDVAPREKLGDPTGLYALWFGTDSDILNMPELKGGQISLQWGDVEKSKGVYDWSELDRYLGRYAKLNLFTTIQINGNTKPKWMFEEIPYYPGKLSIQVRDKYTLMFWHPVHKKAYFDLLDALAEHLKQSPYLKNVIGVRQNPNAFGTEHYAITAKSPVKNQSYDQWIFPKGDDPLATPWSKEAAEEYLRDVLDHYVKAITPVTALFVRNSLNEEIYKRYEDLFRSGKLAWFHTSSEAESRGNENQYLVFMDYCRSGNTLAYAEPWASAWGEHGGIMDNRFCSPEQWNYWRILFDINCGVSFMAIYSMDLEVAAKGTKDGKKVPDSMRAEFTKAFLFGDKYAGTHRDPASSPGAWAAFRQCDSSLNMKKPLQYLTEDYTHLSLVQHGKSRGVHNVGNDSQMYGAWARELPAPGSMSVILHPDFCSSITGKKVTLKVICFDSGNSRWSVSYGGKNFEVENGNSGQWIERSWRVEGVRSANGASAGKLVEQGMIAGRNKKEIAALKPDVTIKALSGNPVFHLVEITVP